MAGIRESVDWVNEKVETHRERGAATTFIIIAILINYAESLRYIPIIGWFIGPIVQFVIPSARFAGFDLTFFRQVIMGGDWFTLYSVLNFNIFFLVIVFAIINLAGGKPHVLRVWLSLILVFYLLSAIPLLNTFMGVRSVMQFIFLLTTAVYLSWKKTTKEDFITTVVLMWAFYNIYSFGITQTMEGLIHFVFFILFYIIFCMGEHFAKDRMQIKGWMLVMILFDFFLPQTLSSMYPGLPIATLPWLTFGVLLFANAYKPYWFPRLLIIVFVSFYFLQLAYAGNLINADLNQRALSDAQIKERGKIFDFQNWKNKIFEWQNRSIYFASGEYFVGTVDQNSKEKLGVYLEDIDKNIKTFYDNERIVIDATLLAKNFVTAAERERTAKPIQIKLRCFADGGGNKIAGKIYPKDSFTVEEFDTENIQCIFEPWQLAPESHQIKIEATFTFETQAYLKRYFAAKELVETLRRKQVIETDDDFLRVSKITELVPKAQNSIGPVEIKISSRMPILFTLSSAEDTRELVGIQLSNKWEGKIKKVTGIEMFIPEGIRQDEGTCSPFAMKQVPLIDADTEGYVRYQLEAVNNPRLADIKKETEQRCWIVLAASERDKILLPGDVTTRYLYFKANYEYSVDGSVEITVTQPPGVNAKLTSSTGVLDSANKPICRLVYDRKESFSDWIPLVKQKKEVPIYYSLLVNGAEQEKASEPCSEAKCEHTFSQRYPKDTLLECRISANISTIGSSDPSIEIVQAHARVKNSAPVIRNVSFNKDRYAAGEIAVCDVRLSDEDGDPVIVDFSFEGARVVASRKDCDRECFIEIPISPEETASQITCVARAYDGEDYSIEHSSTAAIEAT